MHRELIITCEHGGNDVPKEFKTLFKKGQKILNTHRGYDPGALHLAKFMSKTFHVPLIHSTVTRLLVDLNRSLFNKSLYSEFTKELSNIEKETLLEAYYFPFRSKVQDYIKSKVKANRPILHLSIHTFTPKLGAVERKTDIGLLYDPQREQEASFCRAWRQGIEISSKANPFKIRMNYPYRGTSDGLTTQLRSMYGEEKYLGIELEVNQKFPLSHPDKWNTLQRIIVDGLKLVHSKEFGKKWN